MQFAVASVTDEWNRKGKTADRVGMEEARVSLQGGGSELRNRSDLQRDEGA